MINERLRLAGLVAIALAGCTNNVQIVKTVAAKELRCSESELEVRPLSHVVGVSYYAVSGCNRTRAYVCNRWEQSVSVMTTGQQPLSPVCEHDPSRETIQRGAEK